VRWSSAPVYVIRPGALVHGSYVCVNCLGALVLGSCVRVRGSPPMIRPGTLVAGSCVSPSFWVFGCAGFYVHARRDRRYLGGRSAISQMGE
jgi:hypothetical protein